MLQLILALVKRKGISTLNEIVYESGFKREKVILVLNKLHSMGKITFLDKKSEINSCDMCSKCKLCQYKLNNNLEVNVCKKEEKCRVI